MGLVVGTDLGRGPGPPPTLRKKKVIVFIILFLASSLKNLAPLQFYIDKIVRALALAVVK